MSVRPRRTGVTSLSEDELLLFDFMFDSDVPEHMLRREAYPLHMNVEYSHTLDDQALRETLRRLAAHGLVRHAEDQGNPQWGLTAIGGCQWELERNPQWNAYCMDFSRDLRSGPAHCVVVSPDRSTAERFWTAAIAVAYWSLADPRVRHWRIERHQLIPWRVFPELHVVAARGVVDNESGIDWHEYEARRTWWRCVQELNSLGGS